MTPTFRRRDLVGAAGLLILPAARTAFTYQANERLRLALIGHMYNTGHFFTSAHTYEDVEIVALCDDDQRRIPTVFRRWEELAQQGSDYYRRLVENRPPVYDDFRRMLAERGDRIDGLVVSVFDHNHAVICGPAIRAGKHVFSERPLGLTIGEARALREIAARHPRVATSIRNPGNASPRFRRAVELLRAGAIGPVREVHVWFFRGGPDHREPPQGEMPVPPGLNWEVWLGPAAWRPYHPAWMAYAHWRDFSNGGIGTFGPHAANLAFMALKVDQLWQEPAAAPIRVSARTSRRNPLSFPRWEVVRWEVPARGELPPVTFTWHHGPPEEFPPGSRELLLERMRAAGATAEQLPTLLDETAGALILGSEGAIVADDHNTAFTMLPESKFRDLAQDRPETLPPSRGHYRDWIDACRGGPAPWARFAYAGPLSEFLMLGNLATQFEGELEYDPHAGRIRNHADANARLLPRYREGWTW